jgi:hypothetical protein
MIKEVNIFKAGTQTSAQGITREFTKSDLKQIADSYTPDVHEAPIRIGHEDNDKVPAWGWVKGVKVRGDELFAEIEFSPLAEEYIKNGLYKKVSASFYSPDSKINPEPGKWSLRHVALLGAQPPAVKGLKGFAYEEGADGVLDFAVATLSPEAVFDDELGPTLKRDVGPLEILKEKLDEARSQMTAEQQAAAPEQELEAQTQPEEVTAKEEFGEKPAFLSKGKKVKGEKMGEEEESDEEEEDDTMMAAEMADSKLPDALKKNAAKKMAKKRGISEEEAMEEKSDYGSCGKKGMSYEESDSEEHGESEAMHDGKVKGLKAPAAKGMSGMSPEEVDGEGPVASKVKKNAKSGACDPECEDDDKKFEEPTMEASKQKRGTDGLNSTGAGVKETEGGPGGLVRTRSTSKGVNLGFEEADELEDDDEQHVETDDNNYVGKTTKPKHGHDGKSGRKSSPFNDQSGRGEVGKAGADGETGRGKTGKAPEINGYPGAKGDASKVGKDDEDMEENYHGKTGKSSAQDADRKKVGKHGDSKGYPEKYMTTGHGGGSGKQIKGGKVRVMEVNHSEADDRLGQMLARLEELEAANARLREQAEFAERQANRMRLEQFAEGLYEAGKLTEAVVGMDELVDYMEGLEHGTLEFAEGESAATPLIKILSNLPSQVCFEELAGGEVVVSDEALDPHERALKMSKEQDISYTEALKQVLYTA